MRPLITDGVPGIFFERYFDFGVLVPQPLVAETETVPLLNDNEKFTFIERVPFPDVIVAPVGAIQLYEVALTTAATE